MKIPVFVYAQIDTYSKQVQYDVWPRKSEIWSGTCVYETEIDVPDADRGMVLNATVKSMRDEQQKIRAEAQLKAERIEQDIAELLCIEDRSAA